MQALAVHGDGFHHLGKVLEAVRFAADELGLNVVLDHGDEVLREEERVTSARTAVLHGCAVAVGDLAVFEHEHHGDGLACLAHGGEAGGYRGADIGETVMIRAGLDGALIVKVEAGTAGGANNINDLHCETVLSELSDNELYSLPTAYAPAA